MIKYEDVKKDFEILNKIDIINKKIEKRNLKLALVCSLFCGSLLGLFGFINSTGFGALVATIVLFGCGYLLSLLSFVFFTEKKYKKNNIKYKKIENEFFIKIFRKKEKNLIQKILKKLNKATQNYVAEKGYFKEKEIYLNLIENAPIDSLLENINEIKNNLKFNNQEELIEELIDYIFENMNKELFNKYKEKIMYFVEEEFDGESMFFYLNEMKKMKLEYDEETIKKEKSKLRKEIMGDKIEVNKSNKVVQSI